MQHIAYYEREDMKSVGIIAEYNPFHNGHLYHLQKSTELTNAEVSVAVISGHFTQRGSLALSDKWARAETAVKNGINLVVEMPLIFACGNAGYFAKGGVEILENLAVDAISFGSESGNIEELRIISEEIRLHEAEIEAEVLRAVKDGQAYPRARAELLKRLLREDAYEQIGSPNNQLALEYLRFMKNTKPVTVKRQGSGYHDLTAEGDMASATGIRKMLAAGEDISRFVPSITREILSEKRAELANDEMLLPLLTEKVLLTDTAELNSIFGAEEGLGNKLKVGVRYWKSYEDILDGLKSKRYTRTRIARLLVQTLLGVRREDAKQAKNYIRVLAFDELGGKYLKEVKKSGKCELPIITNINKEAENYPQILPTLSKDILATDLYNLACGKDLYANSDYVKMPVKL